MAVTVELKLDTDTLREQMREIVAELREEMVCPCSKRPPYAAWDEVHVPEGRYTFEHIFAEKDRLWSNR
jgi:2-phosphoglycerate kinase